MLLIAHRINQIRELINLNNKYGIEIDIRNYKNELIIEGDVSSKGPNGKIRADRLDFDLNTKKLKISMINNKDKVNIVGKY